MSTIIQIQKEKNISNKQKIFLDVILNNEQERQNAIGDLEL